MSSDVTESLRVGVELMSSSPLRSKVRVIFQQTSFQSYYFCPSIVDHTLLHLTQT